MMGVGVTFAQTDPQKVKWLITKVSYLKYSLSLKFYI